MSSPQSIEYASLHGEAAERLATIFQAMTEGLVVQDADGAIVITNQAAERILGLTVEQMHGRSSMDPQWRAVHENGQLLDGNDHPAMVCLRDGESVRNFVMGVHKPNGELTWISVNSVPRVHRGRREVVSTFHDITRLKAATERAAQQERLATVGTLAAGVGHEINNPLAYILGNLDFSLDELRSIAGPSPSARLRELLEVLAEAREGADRIRRIVRGLRALAREDVALQGVDIAGAVEISQSMAAHEMRHKASVVTEIPVGAIALADESRLTQILVNLLMNAAQAFELADPESNKITIGSAIRPDARVAITIRDNGPGIPSHLLKRIFDPFFTTKPVGQGTGLGLSVSRNLVDALGGELTVESVEGVGTTFTIVLPPAPPASGDSASAARTEPSARIMVVDDDIAVANTIRRILARDHDVVTYNDARLAADALTSGQDFDLILCDLMMPYMSGHELYAKAVAARPELAERFVFVTGGATDIESRTFLGTIANEKLGKPFSSSELSRVAKRFAKLR